MDATRRWRLARPVARLTEARQHWYSIRNVAEGPAQVRIYDEIGYMAVSAQDFLDELSGVRGDIELHLNTPGGDVFDGIAIYNGLRQRQGQVSVIVDSLAASIGSVIAQAASPGQLQMATGSQMMIHDGFALCIGNESDMREMADLLSRQSDNLASIYAARTGQPAAHWREQMRAETWYSAEEAVQAGLADSVLGQPPVQNYFTNATTTTGSSATVTFTAASVDESSWDGGAAMSAAANSDDPAAAYRAICAGRRAGDPSKQSTWALPHHKHPGDAPNRHGVNNALSRLPQTQGLENEAAARAHLEAHQRSMGAGSSSDQADLGWLIDAFKEANH